MFAEKLKNLRKERGLSQSELAKALSVSRSKISMLELDERDPNNQDLISIAKYFNVSTDYLLGLEETKITNLSNDENLSLSDDDVIAAHGKKENVELSEEDLQDIQDFLKHMRKGK